MKKTKWHSTSKQARGYGGAWEKKIRPLALRRDNSLCQCDECKRLGRLLIAHEVHHIKSKANGGTDELDNLIAVNRQCHMRITLAEQGKTYKPKVKINIDGFPEGW